MKKDLYPFKFTPILKDKIWGGHKLKSLLKKNSITNTAGESWEISDIDGSVSVVSNGKLKGTSLKKLLKTYKSELLGQKNYEVFRDKFPLLIKFIDAKEDLSIQLHPNDKLAKARHNSFGKSEMWYVMQADENSNLIVGFNQEMNAQKFKQHLENKTLKEILNYDEVKEGDAYYIEVGRVHAIGAGVMLAEIQQTSDVTYRVYDWDRLDDNGNERELHIDLAKDALDYNMDNNFRIKYSNQKNVSNKMLTCPYFQTNFLSLDSNIKKIISEDSFIIYLCVDGDVIINYSEGEIKLVKGETVLIPAALKAFEFKTNYAKLLEVFV